MSLDRILRMSKTLGDETRLAIYRFLTTRRQPVSVADVARQFGLHPNAARSHLARLEEAGLAASFADHGTSSGRPPRLYRPAAQGMSPIFEPSAYRALAMMLLELLAARPDIDEDAMAEFGRRWGQAHAARYPQSGQVQELGPDYILAGLARTLESWGFTAELTGSPAEGNARVRIARCAFDDLLERYRGLVCPLIHGVLDGMLAAVRPELRFTVERRQPGDLEGCCQIRLDEGGTVLRS